MEEAPVTVRGFQGGPPGVANIKGKKTILHLLEDAFWSN